MHHKKISNYILFTLFWIFLSTTVYYFKIKDLKKELIVTNYKYKYYITFYQTDKIRKIQYFLGKFNIILINKINFQDLSNDFESIIFDVEKKLKEINFKKVKILFNESPYNKNVIVIEIETTQEIKDIDEIININTEKLIKHIKLENFNYFKEITRNLNNLIFFEKDNLIYKELINDVKLINNEEDILTTKISSNLFIYNEKAQPKFNRITIINTIFGSILFSLLLIFLYEIFLIQYNLKLKRKKK